MKTNWINSIYSKLTEWILWIYEFIPYSLKPFITLTSCITGSSLLILVLPLSWISISGWHYWLVGCCWLASCSSQSRWWPDSIACCGSTVSSYRALSYHLVVMLRPLLLMLNHILISLNTPVKPVLILCLVLLVVWTACDAWSAFRICWLICLLLTSSHLPEGITATELPNSSYAIVLTVGVWKSLCRWSWSQRCASLISIECWKLVWI